jgi:hypothetical protein
VCAQLCDHAHGGAADTAASPQLQLAREDTKFCEILTRTSSEVCRIIKVTLSRISFVPTFLVNRCEICAMRSRAHFLETPLVQLIRSRVAEARALSLLDARRARKVQLKYARALSLLAGS